MSDDSSSKNGGAKNKKNSLSSKFSGTKRETIRVSAWPLAFRSFAVKVAGETEMQRAKPGVENKSFRSCFLSHPLENDCNCSGLNANVRERCALRNNCTPYAILWKKLLCIWTPFLNSIINMAMQILLYDDANGEDESAGFDWMPVKFPATKFVPCPRA